MSDPIIVTLRIVSERQQQILDLLNAIGERIEAVEKQLATVKSDAGRMDRIEQDIRLIKSVLELVED